MVRRSSIFLLLVCSGGCVYSPHPLSQPSHEKERAAIPFSRPSATASAPTPAPQKPAAVKPAPTVPRPLLDCMIALDPGHGGSFTGAVGRAGLMEK